MVKVINKKKAIIIFLINMVLMILFRLYQLITFQWLRIDRNIKIKKILIINSGYIGDSILSIPLINNLRNCCKDAKISLVINPKFIDLWKNNKNIDNIILYDAPWIRYKKGFNIKDILTYLKFIKKIRKQRFDLAIDTRGDFRNNLLFLYLSGAKQRIGFGYTGGSYFLTKNVKYKQGIHEVEKNLSLLKAINCPIKETIPELDVKKQDITKIKRILAKNKINKRIVINPFAGYPSKEWPLEKFAELIDNLIKKYKTKIIIIGGSNDIQKSESLLQKIQNKDKIINLTGKLKLMQTAALLSLSDLLIGVDSGPMHMASAVGCKTITLIGPTDYRRWGPYGDKKEHIIIKRNVKCWPCGLLYKCDYDKKCMLSITVEDVLEKVRGLL
ncbi:MAG: glycosyltransferase family 9 protein [Nanoarchaeota archaeon]|nr:glycosyltransferase family 9 protein [Nanoarchaeota archaeon]